MHIDTLRASVIHHSETSGRGRANLFFRRRMVNSIALAASDIIALSTALLISVFLRIEFLGDSIVGSWILALIPVWLIGAAMVRILPSWGLGAVEELRRMVGMLVATFGGVAIFLFFGQLGPTTSRFVLASSFIFSLALVPFFRMQTKRLLIDRGLWGVHTVVYGAGKTAERVIDTLLSETGLGYVPVGLFKAKSEKSAEKNYKVPMLGDCQQNTLKAPVAILAMPGLPREQMLEMLEGSLSRYRQVIVIPDLFEIPSLWVKPHDLGGILGLDISSNLRDPLARYIKRTIDLVLVSLSFPIWGPLCALIGFAIWLEDRKNPIFGQDRMGFGRSIFKTWKFRTMVENAETVLQQSLAKDPLLQMEWETHYKLKNDPRITTVGSFLRKTSLDELPQLINVFKGEMSLVGPRPLPYYHYTELPSRVQKLRDWVRPGMTGLWQVSGRSDSGNAGMERFDPYYVRNWSVWLDVVILVRTFRVVLKGVGAY